MPLQRNKYFIARDNTTLVSFLMREKNTTIRGLSNYGHSFFFVRTAFLINLKVNRAFFSYERIQLSNCRNQKRHNRINITAQLEGNIFCNKNSHSQKSQTETSGI